MSTMKARVVQEPEARCRSIIAPPTAPAIKGSGSLDIECGGCGTVLIQRAQPYLALHNVVIRCPKCKQCNDTDMANTAPGHGRSGPSSILEPVRSNGWGE
jgi:phage FluMu protein Com